MFQPERQQRNILQTWPAGIFGLGHQFSQIVWHWFDFRLLGSFVSWWTRRAVFSLEWGLGECIQVSMFASPQYRSCWWQITKHLAAGYVVAADHVFTGDHVVACPGPSPFCDSKGGSEQRHGHNSVHLWQKSHKYPVKWANIYYSHLLSIHIHSNTLH